MPSTPPANAIRCARRLRRDATEAERRLWRHLRNRQLAGLKFRRQCPVGRFIVDFVCLEVRLVVEVDGGQHAGAAARDRIRDRAIAGLGFRVVRLWNDDVLTNIEGVLAELARHCAPNLPSTPPGRGGARSARPAG